MSAGTIALTNNSAAVTGTGTAFTTDLKANDFIVVIVGGVTYTLGVKATASATSLMLITPYGGPTATGNAWTAVPNATLVGITAQVAADVAKAIRGLNLDKANWQQVYSGAGNITVTLPDGSTFTGPSWNYLATNMATKVSGAVPVNQGGTGATTAATAINNLGGLSKATGGIVTGGITANGGLAVALTSGFNLVGAGGGAGNDITAASGSGSTPNTGFVGAWQYKWYADAWLAGITRGPGTDTRSYGIYYNGGSGTSRLWEFKIDGTAVGAGVWTNGSDERHKSNILVVRNPLAAVCSWRGATYNVLDGGKSVGLIAQEVEPWCPEAVKAYGDRTFSDGTVVKDFKYLDTPGVSAAFHNEAIKELFKLVELALDDPEECRAQIASIKQVMVKATQ